MPSPDEGEINPACTEPFFIYCRLAIKPSVMSLNLLWFVLALNIFQNQVGLACRTLHGQHSGLQSVGVSLGAHSPEEVVVHL